MFKKEALLFLMISQIPSYHIQGRQTQFGEYESLIHPMANTAQQKQQLVDEFYIRILNIEKTICVEKNFDYQCKYLQRNKLLQSEWLYSTEALIRKLGIKIREQLRNAALRSNSSY